MLRLWLVLVLCLLEVTYSNAEQRIPEQLVVIKDVTTIPRIPGEAPFVLHPPSIVRVIERRKNKVLVQRLYMEEEKVAWVPLASVAPTSAFRPMTAWHGQRKLMVSTDDGDYGVTYTFKLDATYRAKFEDTNDEHPGPTYGKGQLYQYGRVIWARAASRSYANGMTLFWLQDNGKLCYSYYDGSCGNL